MSEGRRPEGRVRWLRWMAVVALIFAAGVAAVVLTSDNGAEPETVEWPPTPATGPGSNSLGPLSAPVEVQEWPTPTEGPGSTSLAPTGPGTATADDMAALREWARDNDLTGLSPASLAPITVTADDMAALREWARDNDLTGLSPASLRPVMGEMVDQPAPTTGAGVAGHHRPI